MKKLRGILPHLVIILAGIFLVFLILDQYNPTMEFVGNPISSILLALFCLIEGYALAYGGNLAMCGPARHYPAQVLDRFQQEDDGDTEYYLELLLDDGTQAQVQVSETVYRLEAEGTEFVVCQLESPLGIRMVDLHLPEAAE